MKRKPEICTNVEEIILTAFINYFFKFYVPYDLKWIIVRGKLKIEYCGVKNDIHIEIILE